MSRSSRTAKSAAGCWPSRNSESACGFAPCEAASGLIDTIPGVSRSPTPGSVMLHHGFLRVAAATPQLRVADCVFNADRTLALMQQAEGEAVDVLVFPELGLTGYTCGDLFHHPPLLAGALVALQRVVKASGSQFAGLLVVGLPLRHDDQLFNC